MKKLLLILFFAFLCNVSFSQIKWVTAIQKADSLIKIGDIFFEEEKYSEALVLYCQAEEITKNINNGKNILRGQALKDIGSSYYNMNDYNNALNYYIQALKIIEKTLGKTHFFYLETLAGIAHSYYDLNNYAKSIEYFNLTLSTTKKILGKNNTDYATFLNNIGYAYYEAGEYQNALESLTQSLKIFGKIHGKDNPEYATLLNNIGLVYINLGDNQNALNLIIQATEIRKKVLGEENIDYIGSLNNIGLVYNEIGEYQKSLEYFTQALDISKKVLGENHSECANILDNIGSVYDNMGDYKNALKYSNQTLKIREIALGKDNPNYALSLNNIGSIYHETGDYQNALKYYTQASEIWEKVLGEKHPKYALSLDNIGGVYDDMGDYKNALKYYAQALKIQEFVLGKDNPDYALSLNNIATIYHITGDYQNALKYYTQAMEIWKKVFGEEHPNYALSLNNIGNLYDNMGDYQKALKYYTQALEIKENTLGKEHPDYATSLNNIGSIYFSMKDYQNALKYFTQASEISKKTLGNEHPNYIYQLCNISISHYKMDDLTKAIKINKNITDILRRNLAKNFSFMTAHEREAYWNDNKVYFSCNIKYMSHLPNDTLITKISYDTELITKGLLLASETSISDIIMNSGNDALISEYNTMKIMHQQLDKELERPIAKRIYNCDSLEAEIQKKERLIMEVCKEFGDITHFINIDWKDVQNSLKDNDVAIEFSNMTEYDTTKYLAIILTKSMAAPVCVPVFNEYEIQNIQRGTAAVKTNTQNEDNRGAYAVTSSKVQGIYETTDLYEILWKPLEKYFPENPRIYFAPSGILHQIAVEYAPINDKQSFSDKYEIYRVSSTRFLAMDYTPNTLKNSVLYGGVYYDSDTNTMKQESKRFTRGNDETNASFASLNKDKARSALPYLQGTKTEVENIAANMKKKKISTTLYEGSAANEESFKALSGKNIDVLHIATHGFFLPSDEKLSGDQSLVQSGLLLSGANYAWQNKPLPEGIEDGILTAKEISFMDLRKTDLVVLSACQTALGEITGEGVFGLQRGFKKAGARTIIMSLWHVNDDATQLMMTEFYSNLIAGMSKREAFLAAQNKVKTTKGFEKSKYWAAFIMLDGNEK